MSAPYCKEREANRLLDKMNIENFIPMHYSVVLHRDGKKTRELIPAIHNLIFVKTTKTIIQEAKQQILFLQYYTRPENGKNVPIVVPEAQMRQFIVVCNTDNEKLIFLKPGEVDLKKGTKVRIHGGALDGIEGFFIKLQGVRDKRVVVQIDGITAVATAVVKSDLIEVVSQPKDENSHKALNF